MKYKSLIFSVALLIAPTFVYGACSKQNLTRCLDSVCAINIGANPSARCQYCGTASAGNPTKSNAMKSVSAGTSAKYAISDKELKKAPNDPGERYVWGTQKCLEKVSGCTPDDVYDNYDKLIEQSCRAAGISAEMISLTKKATKTNSQSACTNEISACMVDKKHCDSDYKKCETDSEFDKNFSNCSIASSGCDSFLSNIRKSLMAERKSMFANSDKILESIVNTHKNTREQKFAVAQNSCKNSSAKNECLKDICDKNMRNKCEVSYEKIIANELCKYYDIACERLR